MINIENTKMSEEIIVLWFSAWLYMWITLGILKYTYDRTPSQANYSIIGGSETKVGTKVSIYFIKYLWYDSNM